MLARKTDYEEAEAWAVHKALAWYPYLKSYAGRIYSMGINNDTVNALAIMSNIKRSKLTSPINSTLSL